MSLKPKRKYILAGKWLSLLCVFLLFCFLISREFHKAQLRTLNYFMPSSYEVLLDPAAPASQDTLGRYIIYYKIISALSRGNADADVLLGYCYSRMGRNDTAVSYLEKAAGLKPQSFWVYYDAGVLYLKENDFPKAGQMLGQAINVVPQTALEALYSSKIYLDILTGQGIQPQTVAGRLNKGYQDAYRLLMLTRQIIAKQVLPQDAASLIRSINVQIF